MANRLKSCFDASVTLSSAATTTIVPAKAGAFFVVTAVTLENTSASSPTGSADVTVGANGVSDDIASSQTVADGSAGKPRTVGGLCELALGDGTGVRKRADLTNPIQFTVVSPTGGTLVARCWVEGYYA